MAEDRSLCREIVHVKVRMPASYSEMKDGEKENKTGYMCEPYRRRLGRQSQGWQQRWARVVPCLKNADLAYIS